jgi:hypothetical protein
MEVFTSKVWWYRRILRKYIWYNVIRTMSLWDKRCTVQQTYLVWVIDFQDILLTSRYIRPLKCIVPLRHAKYHQLAQTNKKYRSGSYRVLPKGGSAYYIPWLESLQNLKCWGQTTCPLLHFLVQMPTPGKRISNMHIRLMCCNEH